MSQTKMHRSRIKTHSPAIHALRPLGWSISLGALFAAKVLRVPFSERARILVVHENQILLVRNVAGSGNWTLPGGGIKKSETPAQAAVRELREEVGILARVSDMKNEVRIAAAEIKQIFPVVVYKLELAVLPEVKLSSELLDAAWFSINDPPSKSSPLIKEILNKI